MRTHTVAALIRTLNAHEHVNEPSTFSITTQTQAVSHHRPHSSGKKKPFQTLPCLSESRWSDT